MARQWAFVHSGAAVAGPRSNRNRSFRFRPPRRCCNLRIPPYLPGHHFRADGVRMNTSFFGELLQTISERGRALVERTRERRGSASLSDGLIEQCEALLSGRGEASGVARAAEILAEYATLTTGP